MYLRKTIGTIVLSLTLAATLAACGPNNTEYHYDGKIGQEKVEFYEELGSGIFSDYDTNILKVTRSNEDYIVFIDSNDNLNLDIVQICSIDNLLTEGFRCTYFSRESENASIQQLMEDAQLQFSMYLEQIFNRNASPLYDFPN